MIPKRGSGTCNPEAREDRPEAREGAPEGAPIQPPRTPRKPRCAARRSARRSLREDDADPEPVELLGERAARAKRGGAVGRRGSQEPPQDREAGIAAREFARETSGALLAEIEPEAIEAAE